jgi:serine/threonine protein kinase
MVPPRPIAPATPAPQRPSDSVSDLLSLLVRTPEVDLSAGLGSRLGPGARLGRFVLTHELGRGRDGVVYEAVDSERERPVALKVLSPGPNGAPRAAGWAQREAAELRRLDHPNIVTLHGVGVGQAGTYLVFELLRGRTLRQRLEDGLLDLAGALRIAADVARGLAHAHALGMVHRGLTAAKVFVCDDGTAKVLDFSPSRRLPSSLGPVEPDAQPSPEQQAGWPGDERSDVYALAALLQQMLAAIAAGGREASSSGSALPRRLRRLLSAGLASDPADRLQSAAEWLDELEAVRRGLGGHWPWRGLFTSVG